MINTNKLAFLPLGETPMGLPRNESNSISAPGCKRPPKLQHFFLKKKKKIDASLLFNGLSYMSIFIISGSSLANIWYSFLISLKDILLIRACLPMSVSLP